MSNGNVLRNVLRSVTDRQNVTTTSEKDLRLIRLHVDYVRRTGASQRTLLHRRENLRRLAEKLPCDLLDATADDLNDWQSGLKVSISSMATYSSHARSFYRWAVEIGHIEVDPTQLLPRQKLPARRPRPIPARDFELALECAQDPVYTWLVLGAFMGLRTFEIAAIKREDITEGIIAGKRRTFISGIGKGQKPFKLAVPVEVLPILQRHMTARRGPLWQMDDGRAIPPDKLTREVTAFFRGLGMPYTQHWARHTFGTTVQQQTGDLLQTKVLMRHESTNTTLLYVEPVEGAGLAAMDRLSASLRPRAGKRRAAS